SRRAMTSSTRLSLQSARRMSTRKKGYTARVLREGRRTRAARGGRRGFTKHMANSRSARKRIRSSERKHVRKRAVRAEVRTSVGKARRALLGADSGAETEEQVRTAVRALDRASEKGILHPNN